MAADWTDPAEALALTEVAGSARGTLRLAYLAIVDAQTGVFVRYCDREGEAVLPALSTIALRESDVGQRVLVAPLAGDAEQPVILGLLQQAPVLPAAPAQPARELRVNGRSIEIEGGEQIVLRSGKASITLDASGRIVIKGMEIVSRARGSNKVKGASVLIN